jgi:TonB family protein
MTTNMKSHSMHLLKLLALVPIVGTTLALNARTATSYTYDGPQKQQSVKKGMKKAATRSRSVKLPDVMVIDTEEEILDVAEQMPMFPGGQGAMMEYISNNINYPEEARKNGIQGLVIVTFVVEKDGSITNTRIAKSVDPLLDAEALRLIKDMPRWTPGKQNGKPVRVKYTTPVRFRSN